MIEQELPDLPGTTPAHDARITNSLGVLANWAIRVDVVLGRGELLLMPLFLVAFGVIATIHSSFRPVWFDEWFTYELARLPSLSQFKDALGRGPEQAPPLDYLARRVSMAVIGDNAWGLRLPSVMATGLALICVYKIVAPRLGASYAWASTLVLLVGPAWFYATEARPYALMLGFIAFAFFCWQRTEGREGRTLPLVGLFLAVAAAQSSHYYAIIGVAPLFLGQLVRSLAHQAGRCHRLVHPLRGDFRHSGLHSADIAQTDVYGELLGAPGMVDGPGADRILRGRASYPFDTAPFDRGCGLWCRWGIVLAADRTVRTGGGFRPEERAVAIGYVFLPAFAVLLAKVAGGVVTDRYVIPSTLGFALLIPACIARFTFDAPAAPGPGGSDRRLGSDSKKAGRF